MGRGSNDTGFIDLVFKELTPEEMNSRAESFYQEMNKRRNTRHFSSREVSRSLIEAAIRGIFHHARCHARSLKRQSKPLELLRPELIYNLGHSWRFQIKN